MYYSGNECGLQGALKSPHWPCVWLINKLNTMIAEERTAVYCKTPAQVSRSTDTCTAEAQQRLRTFGLGFLGNKALAHNCLCVSQLQAVQLLPNQGAVT